MSHLPVSPSRLAGRILAMSRRPSSLGATPAGAVSLAMGEPYAYTPAPVVEAAIGAMRSGRTRYEQLTGSVSLRAALATHLTTPEREVTPDQVIVTHGGSGGLAAVLLALINPGDRVVIPEPTYSLYADHVAMAGGEVIWVANRPDGQPDLPAIEESLLGARMIIVCNPSNPTGQVIRSTDMRQLAELAERYDTLLVVDEAYADIVFDDIPFLSSLSLAAARTRVITCGTFSKSYAMTGWRIGWVIAEPSLAAPINLVHRTINGALNTFVQIAAETALTVSAAELAAQAKEYELRRDIVLEQMDALDLVTLNRPQGAFYAFPRVHLPQSSEELVEACARGGVLVRSGREFGPSGEGHIRLSFATDVDSLRLGLDRLATLLRDFDRHR